MRYLLGTTASRPSGRRIAVALVKAGVPLARLERVVPDKRDGRRYLATRTDGSLVDVTVLDRDQEGAGLGYRAWRLLRVRGPAAGRTYVSVRRSLEHEALLAYAVSRGRGAHPSPGRDVGGRRLRGAARLRARRRPPAVGGPQGRHHRRRCSLDAWDQLAALRRLASRTAASPATTCSSATTGTCTCWRFAAARSPPPTSRCASTSPSCSPRWPWWPAPSGPSAPEPSGSGTQPLADALPVLQPLALSLTTRQEVRHDKGVLHELRGAGARRPAQGHRGADGGRPARAAAAAHPVRHRRWQRRRLHPAVPAQRRGPGEPHGHGRLALGGRGAGLLGADLRRSGLLPHRLRPQVGVATSARSSPRSPPRSSAWWPLLRSVGWRSTRASCRRPGSTAPSPWPPSACGRRWRSSCTSSCSCSSACSRGRAPRPRSTRRRARSSGAVLLILVAAVVISLPWGRRVVVARVTDVAGRVIPALVAVAQRPAKLAEGIGGNILLNLAYCGALVASVRAFGGELRLARHRRRLPGGQRHRVGRPDPGRPRRGRGGAGRGSHRRRPGRHHRRVGGAALPRRDVLAAGGPGLGRLPVPPAPRRHLAPSPRRSGQ